MRVWSVFLQDDDLREWFFTRFPGLNELQRKALPLIKERRNVLMIAPTGSGKTFAAFLSILDYLFSLERSGELKDKVYCIYVSPLKALNNDIQRNLLEPLRGVERIRGVSTRIRVLVRSGDTPRKERVRMLVTPPHVLITTPESLGILLGTTRFSQYLRAAEFLILDEIHAIARNKRGTMMSLLMEWLQDENARLIRIGLSATVRPIEVIQRFLGGFDEVGRPRAVEVINYGVERSIEIRVRSPVNSISQTSEEVIHSMIGNTILEELQGSRTVLCFTNTRNATEKYGSFLKRQIGEEKVGVHHGSLNKEERLRTEEGLKKGYLRVVVASSSLELGIDIGVIDKVVQIGSPKRVSTFLQRLGRSGHDRERTSVGVIIATSRDDLLESAILAKLTRDMDLEVMHVPRGCLDVLGQVLIGLSVTRVWKDEEAWNLVRRAYPFHEITLEEVQRVLRVLSEGVGEDGWKHARVWYDQDTHQFGKRRMTRAIYFQNIGTIPDVSSYDVILQGTRQKLGELGSRFAEILNGGDVFILGGKSYEFMRMLGNKVLVRDAPDKLATIPSWYGEELARGENVSKEFALSLQHVLEEWDETSEGEQVSMVQDVFGVGLHEGRQIHEYLRQELVISKTLPTWEQVIFQWYTDKVGRQYFLVLTLRGRQVNHTLGLGIAAFLREKYEVSVSFSAVDNGFCMFLPPHIQKFDGRQVFHELEERGIEALLVGALPHTEYFLNRFRHVVTRSLLVLRQWGGKRISPEEQLRHARRLLRIVKHEPEFPFVTEALREILQDDLRVTESHEFLQWVKRKEIQIREVVENTPSPFTHQLIFTEHVDTLLLEDRKKLLLILHDQLLRSLFREEREEKRKWSDLALPLIYRQRREDHVARYKHEANDVLLLPWFPLRRDQEETQELNEFLSGSLEEFLQILEEKGEVTYELWGEQPDWVPRKYKKLQEAMLFGEQKEKQGVWEVMELIYQRLYYWGPQSLKQLEARIGVSRKDLLEAIERLQRKHIILQSSFVFDPMRKQYVLRDDAGFFFGKQYLQKAVRRRIKNVTGNSHDVTRIFGPMRTILDFAVRQESFSYYGFMEELRKERIVFNQLFAGKYHYYSVDDLSLFQSVYAACMKNVTREAQMVYSLLESTRQASIQEIAKVMKYSLADTRVFLRELSRTGRISEYRAYPFKQKGRPVIYQYLPYKPLEKTRHEAVRELLLKVITWYQPVTLKALLRITRLPFIEVENALNALLLNGDVKRNLTETYEQVFTRQGFESKSNEEQPSNQYVVAHSFDPLFNHEVKLRVPRRNELIILKNMKEVGRIWYHFKRFQELQVITLNLSSSEAYNYSLLSKVITELQRLNFKVFLTPVIRVEQINERSPFDAENQSVMTILKQFKFYENNDSLVYHEITRDNAVKMLMKVTSKLRHESLQTLLSYFPFLEELEVLWFTGMTRYELQETVKKSQDMFYLDSYVATRSTYGMWREKELTEKETEVLELITKRKGMTWKELRGRKEINEFVIWGLHAKGRIIIHGIIHDPSEQVLVPFNDKHKELLDRVKKKEKVFLTPFQDLQGIVKLNTQFGWEDYQVYSCILDKIRSHEYAWFYDGQKQNTFYYVHNGPVSTNERLDDVMLLHSSNLMIQGVEQELTHDEYVLVGQNKLIARIRIDNKENTLRVHDIRLQAEEHEFKKVKDALLRMLTLIQGKELVIENIEGLPALEL